MPLTQENGSVLRPSHLFQISNTGKTIVVTNSNEQFWIKDTNWEAVKIDKVESYRDGGTISYYFNYCSKFSGKTYTEIFIPSPIKSRYEYLKLPYIEGKTSLGRYLREDLDEILLSQKTLNEIGITQHLKLDITNIPELHTPEQHTAYADKQKEKRLKCSTQFFRKPKDDFLEVLFSKTESSISEKLTGGSK